MNGLTEEVLEKKAKTLLLWKIENGDGSCPVDESFPLSESIGYLESKGYISGIKGQTAKSFMAFPYEATTKGREWALK